MTENEKHIFNRSELLLGEKAMQEVQSRNIILFGVGGVGSWCAESLIRNGIKHLTIVDTDNVCITNCNRQLMATTKTIGQAKVTALQERLKEINPEADITALQEIYNAETSKDFQLENYDYVIDAIDSLQEKCHLILTVTRLNKTSAKRPTLISSMGAALRIDPTKIRLTEFWNIKGDPLARAIRNKFKRTKEFPSCKFQCVWSEEQPLPNLGTPLTDNSNTFSKVQTNGSLCHITGIFGMTMAGWVIKDIYAKHILQA